jgi:hypothetical protein
MKVGIVDGYTQADWANDIALAAATGIDAFACKCSSQYYLIKLTHL